MTLAERRRAVPVRIQLVLAVGALLSSSGVVAVDQGLPSSPAPIAPVGGFNPTRNPARFPTPRPASSQFGTDQPTFAPIIEVTLDPTWDPSPAPSAMPSESPALPPTPRPTRIYTPPPPTQRPTRIFTPDAPVGSLTPEPSMMTGFPTLLPSPLPTDDTPTTTSTTPVRSPTMPPTLGLQDYLISVIMYLEYAQILGSSSEITFQRVTGDFIETEFLTLDVEWTDLSVGTNVKSQRELAEVPATAGSRRSRSLQAPVSVLEITFDTQVSFRSDLNDLDIAAFIGGAFNTEEDRATYIKNLQSSGDRAFAYVSAVKVVINGEEQDVNDATQPPSSSSGLSSFTLYIIIGAAGGGLCIAVLATLFYLRHRGNRKPVTVSSTENSGGHMGERVGADIVMDNQDDISTLGDPMYAPGGMMMGGGLERDETVSPSIVSGDWDYTKNYGGALAGPDTRMRTDTLQSSQNGSYADLSSFGGLTKMDNSIFSDDMSFEQQFAEVEERFEVDAPAGKLGMVIDTPSGGVPIVHAIKNSSVLADRVEVGDRLISVDDEDTTGLTAMQVSKMISQKADNPSRILVFARSRARAMSGDRMPQ